MTTEQAIIIDKARHQLHTVRQMLDDVMYRIEWRDKLSESEFRRIRQAYDLLCQANDRL